LSEPTDPDENEAPRVLRYADAFGQQPPQTEQAQPDRVGERGPQEQVADAAPGEDRLPAGEALSPEQPLPPEPNGSTEESHVSEQPAPAGLADGEEQAARERVDPARDDDEPVDLERDAGSAGGETPPLAGKQVALVGRFGSMNRREASNVVESFQAKVVELPRRGLAPPRAAGKLPPVSVPALDWVVIGAEEPPLSQSELLPREIIDAAALGELEILHETELWQRLGLVDVEDSVRRFYTPVMLADLLGVSVRVIRRWQRRGLITPAVTVHKLPYFDYAEVASAKRLAGWIAAGASPAAIERRLADLVQVLPNIRRPLDQLSILVEGKHVLLRQGDGLVEPGGQMRFDFEALDHGGDAAADAEPVVAYGLPDQPPMLRTVGNSEADPVLAAAYEAEDADDLEAALEHYHTLLARDGPRADINFQIAELLYRMNFLMAARERYYAAIELDPEFVEARASLGAVLAELGQSELAIAALRGSLSLYEGYVDVHYTLAKTLDHTGQSGEALEHWHRILELAPESPWADEARQRLGMESL
jgi:tetratricopeptide (TPR) repeat protein